MVFDDPFRPLEEETPETRRWQEQQNSAAETRIHALPGIERLRDATLARQRESLVFAPARYGQRWFRLAAGRSGTKPVLAVASEPGDRGRVVVDPGTWPGTEVSLDWFSPAPNGEYVAVGLSQRGDEQSVLHVLEVESGRELAEPIPHVSFGVVAWLPDSSGFFYNAGLAPDTEQPQKHIFFHRLGDEQAEQPEPAPVRRDEEFVFPQVSPDGRWVFAVSSEVEPRPDSIREVDGGEWRSFLLGLPGTFAGLVHEDRYVAITTDGAPRGRLVSIPLEGEPARSTWRELVPEGEGVMRSVCIVGGRLALVDLVETRSRIRIFSLDGELEHEVPLPGEGTVGTGPARAQAMIEPMVSADDDALLFVFSTFSRPPSLYRYALEERRLEELSTPAQEIPGLVCELRSCRSTNGAEVSYWLVHSTEADQRPAGAGADLRLRRLEHRVGAPELPRRAGSLRRGRRSAGLPASARGRRARRGPVARRPPRAQAAHVRRSLRGRGGAHRRRRDGERPAGPRRREQRRAARRRGRDAAARALPRRRRARSAARPDAAPP